MRPLNQDVVQVDYQSRDPRDLLTLASTEEDLEHQLSLHYNLGVKP